MLSEAKPCFLFPGISCSVCSSSGLHLDRLGRLQTVLLLSRGISLLQQKTLLLQKFLLLQRRALLAPDSCINTKFSFTKNVWKLWHIFWWARQEFRLMAVPLYCYHLHFVCALFQLKILVDHQNFSCGIFQMDNDSRRSHHGTWCKTGSHVSARKRLHIYILKWQWGIYLKLEFLFACHFHFRKAT